MSAARTEGTESAASGRRSVCPASGSTRVSRTSARPVALRLGVPLKITSCIRPLRKFLADCSPSTQLTASLMFDFPQPFGPTMAAMPSPWKAISVRSANDLNPSSSIFCSFSNSHLSIREPGSAGKIGAKQPPQNPSSIHVTPSSVIHHPKTQYIAYDKVLHAIFGVICSCRQAPALSGRGHPASLPPVARKRFPPLFLKSKGRSELPAVYNESPVWEGVGRRCIDRRSR